LINDRHYIIIQNVLLILMTRQQNSKFVINLFQPCPKSWSDILPAACAPHAL